MVSPSVRRSSSDIPATSRLTSIGLGASGWRRENASRRWVSVAARSPPRRGLDQARSRIRR